MLKYLPLLAVLAGCVAPGISAGPPGDELSTAWVDPVDRCPGGLREVNCHGSVLPGRTDIRESCMHYRHCVFDGPVRIRGDHGSANSIDPELSRTAGYIGWVHQQAVHDVEIVDSRIFGAPGNVTTYVSPGVTHVTFRRVRFTPRDGCKVLLYLGAETLYVTVEDSELDARACDREAIAVDASGHNTIRDNEIVGGSIKLYRNCGESGVTRHGTPSDNEIVGNDFFGVLVNVHLSSRDGSRGFCGLDDGLSPYGSARSNYDWARRNRVHANSGGISIEGLSASDNYGNDLLP